MQASPEPPKGNSSQEPSKWNLPAWIWWKLAEPPPGEPQPYFPWTTSPTAIDDWPVLEDNPPDSTKECTSPEPSKWNVVAWIWWKLGEPSPDDGSKPVFIALDKYRHDPDAYRA